MALFLLFVVGSIIAASDEIEQAGDAHENSGVEAVDPGGTGNDAAHVGVDGSDNTDDSSSSTVISIYKKWFKEKGI